MKQNKGMGEKGDRRMGKIWRGFRIYEKAEKKRKRMSGKERSNIMEKEV